MMGAGKRSAAPALPEWVAPQLTKLVDAALPDRQVLTESAAITLHLADATQSADLVPGPGENARPACLRLRWLPD